MDWKEFFKFDKYNLFLLFVITFVFVYLNFRFPRYFNQNLRGIIYESTYYAGFPMIFYDVGFDVPGNYFYSTAFFIDFVIFVLVLFLTFLIMYKTRIKTKST